MEPELAPRVVENLALLAGEVMARWYWAMGEPAGVVVEWRVPALLGAVWSEN